MFGPVITDGLVTAVSQPSVGRERGRSPEQTAVLLTHTHHSHLAKTPCEC